MVHRLFVYQEEGATFAYPMRWFAQFGLMDEPAVSAVYGESGEWCEFVTRPLTGGTEPDIQQLARIPNDIMGFVLDGSRIPAARAAVMVARWTVQGIDGQVPPITMEGFRKLPKVVADQITAALQVELDGGQVDPRFLAFLRDSDQQSLEKPKDATEKLPAPDGATSTTV